MVEGNLAFNVARLRSYESLLQAVSGRKVKAPSRRRLMKKLGCKFKLMKSALKARIAKQEYICMTCDVWSCRRQSFLGVTVHFLSEEFKRESYVLAFKRLYRRQTYIELAQQLDKIFIDFEIKIEQVTHTVTDGGSAFCKMFKKFGTEADVVVQADEEEDDVAVAEVEEEEEVGEESGEENEEIVVKAEAENEFMQNEDGELFHSEILELQTQQDVELDGYFSDNVAQNEEPSLKLPPQRVAGIYLC